MRKRLKTALVGFGTVAVEIAKDRKMAKYIRYQTHAQVLQEHPDFDWQAVVDPDPVRRQCATDEWDIPIVVKSVSELLKCFCPDVMVIASPANVRGELLENLSEIKAILVEKPLGYNLDEAKAFVQRCQDFGIKLQVNLFRRADETNRMLLNGYLAEYIGPTQTALSLYGNGLFNNGIHMIDLIRMLLGEVTEVRALGPVQHLKEQAVKNDVNLALAMRLENDATVMMHPINFNYYRDVILDIWGEKGRLEIFQEGLFLRRSPLKPHRALEGHMEVAIDEPIYISSKSGEAYYQVYENLAAALNGECDLYSPGENALKSEAVIAAALASAADGKNTIMMDKII